MAGRGLNPLPTMQIRLPVRRRRALGLCALERSRARFMHRRFFTPRLHSFIVTEGATMEELEALLRAGGDAPGILRHIRLNKIRAPAEVLRFGRDYVLQGTCGRLGDEAWSVYEQVMVAALELGEMRVADTALARLQQQFPGSVRVQRLVGMKAEAMGDFAEAERIYAKLREENPTNPLVLKRHIAVAKARGEVGEAIKRCNEYLKLFTSDTQAWQELGELYLCTGQPSLAAFCYEELVLFQPSNFAFHTALAEAYYTASGSGASGGPAGRDAASPTELLRLARKHYAQAVELLQGETARPHLRALYGLCTTCHAIATTAPVDAGDVPVNAALFKLAAEQIAALYRGTNPGLLPVVEAALKEQEAAVVQRSG